MNRVFVATAVLSTALVLGLPACQQTPAPPPDTSEFDQGVVVEEEIIEEVVVEIDLGTIYFDFDKSNIREDARSVLRANAEALIASGDVEARERLNEGLPTSGLAVIDFAGKDWRKVHPHSGRLERFVSPRSLAAADRV